MSITNFLTGNNSHSKTYYKLLHRIQNDIGYSVEGDEACGKAIERAWNSKKITDDEYEELDDMFTNKSPLFKRR